MRRLGKVRRKHLAACEALIAIKNEQMREIEDFCGSVMSRSDSAATLG
jgi:hypothetical protein